MKVRTVILLALVAMLLVGSVVLAQSGGAQARYVVQEGTLFGGGYRLTSGTWAVNGAAIGGKYHLLVPAGASAGGGRCCCNYLPCVMRR